MGYQHVPLLKMNLRGKILLDWCRGTRVTSGTSSASSLAPLVQRFHNQFKVFMFHTPLLRGFYKRYLPPRWNETIGLQHCKIYIFDDSVIISGANLSNDYFTNRQDRYVLIEYCKPLADFYEKLVDKISQFSLQMNATQEFNIDKTKFWCHPYEGELSDFKKESGDLIKDFICEETKLNRVSESDLGKYDTWIFPTVQMGQLGVIQDSKVTVDILRSGEEGGRSVNL